MRARAVSSEEQAPSDHKPHTIHTILALALRFKVTIHSGHGAPADAIESLWERWPARISEATAVRRGPEIHVNYGSYDGTGPAREQRAAAERIEVLDLVREICERDTELKLAWYAVAPVS